MRPSSIASSLLRARATRLVIVPTAQPQIDAASSYEKPLALTRRSAARWPADSAASARLRSRNSSSPSWSGGTLGSGSASPGMSWASNFRRRSCE
jgi:hypothetical protein